MDDDDDLVISMNRLLPFLSSSPLPLSGTPCVLRRHESHEVLGRLVAGISASKTEINPPLGAEMKESKNTNQSLTVCLRMLLPPLKGHGMNESDKFWRGRTPFKRKLPIIENVGGSSKGN